MLNEIDKFQKIFYAVDIAIRLKNGEKIYQIEMDNLNACYNYTRGENPFPQSTFIRDLESYIFTLPKEKELELVNLLYRKFLNIKKRLENWVSDSSLDIQNIYLSDCKTRIDDFYRYLSGYIKKRKIPTFTPKNGITEKQLSRIFEELCKDGWLISDKDTFLFWFGYRTLENPIPMKWNGDKSACAWIIQQICGKNNKKVLLEAFGSKFDVNARKERLITKLGIDTGKKVTAILSPFFPS